VGLEHMSEGGEADRRISTPINYSRYVRDVAQGFSPDMTHTLDQHAMSYELSAMS